MAAGDTILTSTPGSAIAGLVALAKIHPGLSDVAVTLVLDGGEVYDSDPWTWRDVAKDPLAGRGGRAA